MHLFAQVQHFIVKFRLDGSRLLSERVPLKLARGGEVTISPAFASSCQVCLAKHLARRQYSRNESYSKQSHMSNIEYRSRTMHSWKS